MVDLRKPNDAGYSNPFAAPETDVRPVDFPGAPAEVALAERGTRLAGAMLDTILYLAAAVPGIVLLVVLSDESVAAWVTIALPILGLGVYQMILVAGTGQSLAKRWLKMKIVKIDGSDVDFVSGVILRSWVMAGLGMIPFIGNFIGIIDAVMIFGDDRRCLHDKIASTKVIDLSTWGA